MTRKSGLKGLIIGLVLAAFVIVCRLSTGVADFYALKLYPAISTVLSLISSPAPVSVNDLLIVAFVAIAIALLIKKRFIKLLSLFVWIFVWLYLGWAANYYRSNIFTRAGLDRQSFDNAVFTEFLNDYTANLNDSYQNNTTLDSAVLQEEIKKYYYELPKEYGLCKPRKWQHPKPMLMNRVQSAVGVTGYEGPFAAEFHINSDVLESDYPFTYAHEMSHLMGVSSEAEANWWAFDACRKSTDPALRYSAYYAILGYVWNNARSLLSPEDFDNWSQGINPQIVEDLRAEQKYWSEKEWPFISKIQSAVYNLFLKGNRISSGTKNYSEMVGIIIAFDYKTTQ